MFGHKLVAISANSLLDIQIVLGVVLIFFGFRPPVTHLLVVAATAVLAHFSYSVEKRKGSSSATLIAAWVAVIPVLVLFFWR